MQGTHETECFTSGVLVHEQTFKKMLNKLFDLKYSRLPPW